MFFQKQACSEKEMFKKGVFKISTAHQGRVCGVLVCWCVGIVGIVGIVGMVDVVENMFGCLWHPAL